MKSKFRFAPGPPGRGRPPLDAVTNPADLAPGLWGWWNPAVDVYSDTGFTTPITEGGTVAGWKDQSGNGHDWVTGSGGPTWSATGFNTTKPGLIWPFGVNYLQAPSTWSYPGPSFTIYFTGALAWGGVPGSRHGVLSAAFPGPYLNMDFGYYGNAQCWFGANYGTAVPHANTGSSPADGTPLYVTVQLGPTASIIRFSGVTNTDDTVNGSIAASALQFVLGWGSSNGASPGGPTGEMLIYAGTEHDLTQIAAVESFIKTRAGL